MKNNFLETLIGFLILILATFFLIFAYNKSGLSKKDNTYSVFAIFENIEGINQGSDIMISGVKIGYIKSIILDPKNYLATVELQINNDIKIPTDSRASIVSNGFLGGKFISIAPGQSEQFIQPKDNLENTQAAVNFESLLGKFIYSIGSSSKK